MKLLAKLPPREIEGADQVLDGAVAEMESGNHCRFWPAMTRDPEKNLMRIAFFQEWRLPTTPNDTAEMTAYLNELMNGTPALITESADPFDKSNLEWLRSGKTPPPKRTN